MIYCHECKQPIMDQRFELLPLPRIGEYAAIHNDCIDELSKKISEEVIEHA